MDEPIDTGRRWYHGPLGNQPRAESRETAGVSLTPEETAAWLAWAREEGEQQKEEKHGKPVPTR